MMELSREELRELQLTEFELLSEVDRVCRKNNIRYSLYAGTLLGAVRHKGFIPWDDDADICFLPEEYEKFFEACKRDLNTKKFFLQDYRTDPHYRWGYAKLRRNGTSFVRTGQEHIPCHTGICIDLFVLYPIPDSLLSRKLYYASFYIIRKILYSEVGRVNEKKFFKRAWFNILSKIPRNSVFNLANRLMYKKDSELRDMMYITHSKRYIGVPTRFFDADVELEFEGRKFLAMYGYDECLKMAYGDYMQLPPENERASHNPASKIEFVDRGEAE